MTEKLICSNCGGPVTRTGAETHVTCTHCGVGNDFAPVPSAAPSAASSAARVGDYGSIPARSVAPQVILVRDNPQPVPQIIVVEERVPTIVRRRRGPSFGRMVFAPLFFILIAVGVSAFIRSRAARVEEAAEHAEKGAEKAAEHAEKQAEHGEKKHK